MQSLPSINLSELEETQSHTQITAQIIKIIEDDVSTLGVSMKYVFGCC